MLAINEKQESQVNSQPRISFVNNDFVKTLTIILDVFQNLFLKVRG